jgi:hypothetical protein
MTNLEKLRQLVADMFEKSTDKDSIEQATRINSAIDDVAAEQQEIVDKNAELIKDYKTLVKHTSFSQPAKDESISGSDQFDLDDAISKAFAKLK